MRMRKKKHGAERMEACRELWLSDKAQADEIVRSIKGSKKLCVEIGCGKGTFVCEMAKKYDDRYFIALEKVADVIVVAMEKCKEAGIENVRFISGDVKLLAEFFDEESIDEIYLNFSDPWPKAGHKKRRLTYREFLELYKKLLKQDGVICFKTDNRGLFDFTLEEMAEAKLETSCITYDLHNSEYDAENIRTEYEKTFSARGFTINRVVARKTQNEKNTNE